ncbi:MAG: BofC C-terminal domain-containing protein [Sporomusaceae bacterium]|nr:BofC C-terminal domain-containing protein [Sporomusaceae bacterium]
MLQIKKINIKFVLLATSMLLIVGLSAYYIAYLSFAEEDKSLPFQETEVIKPEGKIKINANTDLVQKIVYLKCNDEELLRTKPTEKLVGLTIYQLQKVYQGWVFDKFDNDEVDMSLKVDSYCREHANNMFVGISDDNVAIFYGKPGSRPIIKEKTNIKASQLMAEDVEELKHGIVVSSQEELLRTLEGMQSR